jgi:hypothetical protein
VENNNLHHSFPKNLMSAFDTFDLNFSKLLLTVYHNDEQGLYVLEFDLKLYQVTANMQQTFPRKHDDML